MSSWGGKRSGGGRPPGSGRYGVPTKAVRVPEHMLADIQRFVEYQGYQLPLYSSRVRAGFPSPADDHVEARLDLNDYMVKHPAATFFVRVAGDSMVNAGIFENDMLVVDRSLEAASGRIVIAVVNQELTVKRFQKTKTGCELIAENPTYPPIIVEAGDELHIWGVVTHVIHSV